jgi:hypothetical protein
VVHLRSLFRIKRVNREMMSAALVLKSAFAVHEALRIELVRVPRVGELEGSAQELLVDLVRDLL